MTLGTINGYVVSRARHGQTRLEYDGTTKGLTNACVAAGLPIGAVVVTDTDSKMMLIAAPHDDRAGGYWMDRVW